MCEVRCPKCKKLLFFAEGKFKIQIKCNKCKNIVELQREPVD